MSAGQSGGYAETGGYWQGRGYGQGGTCGQTGKYGQIGAQMGGGGGFAEGYGQGAHVSFRGKEPEGNERSDNQLKTTSKVGAPEAATRPADAA